MQTDIKKPVNIAIISCLAKCINISTRHLATKKVCDIEILINCHRGRACA